MKKASRQEASRHQVKGRAPGRDKGKLGAYRAKRHFDVTAEPKPKVAHSRTGRMFVIQKHDASRLHYDFRLEHDGVLKSWAVPKGPSLIAGDKSLAVQVEDHPVDYGSFEGVIPEGEYGGGTVLLWDRGTWEPVGDADEGFRTGKLKFILHGEKLRGRFMLVRMHGRDNDEKKNWLLFKERDAEARTGGDVRVEQPLSVESGRDLEQIAADRDRVWGSNRAGKKRGSFKAKIAERAAKVKGEPGAVEDAAFPEAPAPELATLVDEPPVGDEWVHEIKFDGYRILCLVRDGEVRLLSRRANDWTGRFGAVADAAGKLECQSAVIDGEVVVVGEGGRSDFQALQNVLKGVGPRAKLQYFAFDLLYLDGKDLTGRPLLERKHKLEELLASGGTGSLIRLSEHIVGHGQDVFDQACGNGLEGIVSKRATSLYTARRTKDWVKVKCGNRQEFVIGGYTEPSGARTDFGALLLGYFEKGGLVYCGKVGTGFTGKTLRSILAAMKRRETDRPAFRNPPRGAEARGVHWLRPELVGEVQFSEWTRDGTLRHPSFQGLREDKDAGEVVREKPKHSPDTTKHVSSPRSGTKQRGARQRAGAPAAERRGTQEPIVAGVVLSNPGRVMYPENGVTKLELARYYEAVAGWVLPHLVGRPLTLVRCPEGREKTCFYQKHLTDRMPASVHGVGIREKNGVEEYVAIEDVTGIVGLVQLGVLEFHTWGAREDNVEAPDRLIIDLDPGPGVTWERVVGAAVLVRERLAALGFETFVKTTGGKGLHVALPIARRSTWDQCKAFTKAIADQIVRDFPSDFTAVMTKAKRTNKVYIDYLRNGRGATAVAPYSTRRRENAPISMPLSWEELEKSVWPLDFTVRTAPEILTKGRRDPWAGISGVKQAITAKAMRAVGA